jgi:hypothetical protein
MDDHAVLGLTIGQVLERGSTTFRCQRLTSVIGCGGSSIGS